MKNWTITRKTYVALILSYVIIIAVGVSLYVKVELFVRNERWVSHTNAVMDHLDQIVLSLVNMETGLRGYAAGGDPKFLEPYDTGSTGYTTHLKEVQGLVADNPAQVARLQELDALKTRWMSGDVAQTRAEREKLTSAEMSQKDFDASFNQGRGKVVMDGMRAKIQECKEVELALMTVRQADFQAAITAAKQWVVLGLSSAVILGLVLTGWVVNGTSRVLRQVASALNDASGQIASAAGQVSSASQSLAEGSSAQAASIEETAASLEEILAMTKRNAESADAARAIAGETSEATEAGSRQMLEMENAMSAIKSASDNIAKIIKTIDEIAFQTNILALNAAVEAARAGEAGAGFAVVADEVRALAQRAAQAARETTDKIADSITKSGHGVELSTKVSAGLREVTEKTRRVNELVIEIASASKEQNQGIGQVGGAVTQMDKITQSNASGAEETAAAAEELNAQAASLLETVGQLQALVGGNRDSGRKASHASPATACPAPSKLAVAR